MKKMFYSFESDSGVVFEAFEDGSARFALKRAAFDDPAKEYDDAEGADKIVFEYNSKNFKGMSDVECDDLINKFYSFTCGYPFEHFSDYGNIRVGGITNEDVQFEDNNFDNEQDCRDYLSDCFYDIAEAIEAGTGRELKACLYIPSRFYTDETCELIDSCIGRLEDWILLEWKKELKPKAHTAWAITNIAKYKEIAEIANDILEARNAMSRHYTSFDFAMSQMTSSGKYKETIIKPSDIKKGADAVKKDDKEVPFDLNEVVDKNFEGLIGLEEIKLQLKETLAYCIQNKGNDDDLSLHMAFVGNAGTGKTTVAEIVAKILAEAKVLKSGKLNSKNATSLQAEYLGQTPAKVEEMIEDGIGKVTLIDEAYALAQGTNGGNEYKKEAVSTLITGIEEHRKDACFIFAGYPKEMEAFFNMNPGLKSRIPNIIEFKDFSKQDIKDIFDMLVKKSGKSIDQESVDFAHDKLATLCKNKNFANARGVRNVFMKIKRKQALRVNGNPDDKEILLEDVKNGFLAFEKEMTMTEQRAIGFGVVEEEREI